MIVAYKPLGWHKAWHHATLSGLSYDADNKKYEFKIDREDVKEQLHVVMIEAEAMSLVHAGIMRLIENGHLDQIHRYIKDGLESKAEVDAERQKESM